MTSEINCGNCAFYDIENISYVPNQKQDYGICRRNAPSCSARFKEQNGGVFIPIDNVIKNNKYRPIFPIVSENDWCGEFTPIE